jgi:hypothetical protein
VLAHGLGKRPGCLLAFNFGSPQFFDVLTMGNVLPSVQCGFAAPWISAMLRATRVRGTSSVMEFCSHITSRSSALVCCERRGDTDCALASRAQRARRSVSQLGAHLERLGLVFMRACLVIVLFAISPAFAEPFRGTQFGEPCSLVAEREAAFGSVHAPWQNPSPQILTFRGTALGRPAYIIYVCPKDVLAVGAYHFPKARFAAAAADFSAAVSHFTSLYGHPLLPLDRFPSNEPQSAQSYTAFWRVGLQRVSVNILRDGEFGRDSWQALVMFSEQPRESRPNKSMEPTRER